MKALEATEAHECAANMESVSGASKRRRHCLRSAVNGAPFVLSAVSVAFCVLLGVQTNDVKNRMTDLESARLSYPLAALSTEQLNSVIRERVDELLAQRTYEQFSRIRTARQASPECNCPPGMVLEATESQNPNVKLKKRIIHFQFPKLELDCSSIRKYPSPLPQLAKSRQSNSHMFPPDRSKRLDR
ncbi:hypothetical protein SRHO_G00024060 [Serrasalmus rhombeus]